MFTNIVLHSPSLLPILPRIALFAGLPSSPPRSDTQTHRKEVTDATASVITMETFLDADDESTIYSSRTLPTDERQSQRKFKRHRKKKGRNSSWKNDYLVCEQKFGSILEDDFLEEDPPGLGGDAVVAITKNKFEIDRVCVKLDSERTKSLAVFEPKMILDDCGFFLVDCLDQTSYLLEGGRVLDESVTWANQSAKKLRSKARSNDVVAELARENNSDVPDAVHNTLSGRATACVLMSCVDWGIYGAAETRNKKVSFADVEV
jgi:hypothetical protein